jgi:hypothetical protein
VKHVPARMTDDPKSPERFSLKRWSQRKREATRTAREEPVPPPAAAVAVTTPSPMAVVDATVPEVAAPAPLPPLESLTFDSDYSAFMQPKVEEATRRAALKKLFSDPSFNVMDGLDIYVGDYTQPDPMPAGMLEKLAGVYAMLDKPDRDEPPEVDNAEPPRATATGAAPADGRAGPSAAPVDTAGDLTPAGIVAPDVTAPANDVHDLPEGAPKPA